MNRTGILITDFDGTVTQNDFYDLVCQRFPEIKTFQFWEKYERGELTHFEAMQGIFGQLRSNEEEIIALLNEMKFDPFFPAALNDLGIIGWKVMIVSAGSTWYIRKLLAKAGIVMEVHSNPGEYNPESGLKISRPEQDSPYYCENIGVDKAAAVKQAKDQIARVAYAGDGRTDIAPALLVPPQFRFATGWLANHLKEEGKEFHSFERWPQIVEILNEYSK
jgi:2-hydroxy-3-keto-5-methylthiopentenyl-1-phosphate phosphatase